MKMPAYSFFSELRAVWGWRFFIFPLLMLWGAVGLAQIVISIPTAMGARDLHSYWYYGHFIREHKDPYQAFITQAQPALPVHYLDGVTTQQPPLAQPDLPVVPANTAPMVLLLSLLSFFSWPSAKIIWMLLNLLFLLAIPGLCLRLLPVKPQQKFTLWLLVSIALWSLTPARVAASGGQTTLLVFVCMLAALAWAETRPLLAGLFLGLALSKYSLALPLVLLLLYQRRLRVVGLGLLVQLVGAAALALWSASSLADILGAYWFIFQFHTPLEGIHLGAWLPGAWGAAAVVLLTLLTGLGLVLIHRRAADRPLADLLLLVIFSLWTLLAAYHRKYDATLWLLFATAGFYGVADNAWRLAPRALEWVKTGLVLLLCLMSIPGGGGFEKLFPPVVADNWSTWMNALTTVLLICTLAGTFWLYRRLNQV